MSKQNKRRLFFLLLFVCASSFGVLLLRWKSPTELRLPPCLFRKTTGLYCPGCGSTRAVWRLLQGDIRGSLRFHPLVAPCSPLLAFLFFQFFRDLFRGASPYRRSTLFLGLFFLAAFLTLFVLRNIPCAALDFLRPPGEF